MESGQKEIIKDLVKTFKCYTATVYIIITSCLFSSVGGALPFHHCIPGLVPRISMRDSYGWQSGQSGYSCDSDSITNLGFFR